MFCIHVVTCIANVNTMGKDIVISPEDIQQLEDWPTGTDDATAHNQIMLDLELSGSATIQMMIHNY